MAEGLGPLLGFEVELDDHMLSVIDWAADPISEHAGVLSGVGETVKRHLPGEKITDRMLDAQGEHDDLGNG
jgi:hypothetical protein